MEIDKELEYILKEKEKEINLLKEKERVAFYSEVRQALQEVKINISEINRSLTQVQNWITIMGDTKEIKATLEDYKIFKAQIKTGLVIMNVIWGVIIILVNWFLKK